MTAHQVENTPIPRLYDFLRTNEPDIIGEWSRQVRALSPARELSESAIIDHLPQILALIADVVESGHTGRQDSRADLPERHAISRLRRGFDLDQIIVEYGLLHKTIFDLWESRAGSTMAVAELRNLDAAFFDAIEQATVRYSQAREKLLRALDRVSEQALAITDLDRFLQELLQLILEGTESADSCIIFLREGDWLHVRAAAGLEQELVGDYSVRIGESFAGQVAQQRRALALRHASEDPAIKNRVIRGSGMRALYGIPMLQQDDVMGVAHIGSRTAFEFSEEDKLLFRTVVRRATTGIERAQDFAAVERSEAAQRFLSAAALEFSKSLDFEGALAKVAHLAVPVIADWCVVDCREGERIRRLVAAHSDPVKTSIARALEGRHATDPNGPQGVARVFRTAKTEWAPEITEAELAAGVGDAEQLEILRAMGLTSYIIVPVSRQDEVHCTITLVTAESRRRYSETDVRVAEQLADRASAALENQRLFAVAQYAVAARQQILAIVAHDLRNQLMVIGTGAALLTQTREPVQADSVKKTSERIVQTIGTMRQLVDDLLDTGAIEAGKLSFNPEPVAVAAILKAAYENHRAAAEEKGLELKVEPDRGNLRVQADSKRIMQVLSNLLGNAIKFTPYGGAIALRAGSEEAQVRFSVSDTGPGVSESDLATLFEPYRMVEKHARAGSGLGLYIARSIVGQHGGRIWASSEVGKGSTFYFTLPRVG